MAVDEYLYILYEATRVLKPLVHDISLNKGRILQAKNTLEKLEPNKIFYVTKQKV